MPRSATVLDDFVEGEERCLAVSLPIVIDKKPASLEVIARVPLKELEGLSKVQIKNRMIKAAQEKLATEEAAFTKANTKTKDKNSNADRITGNIDID